MEKVDRIERRIEVSAPVERVWEALTDAADVAQWFGDVVEIDLRPGGRARFGWTQYDSVVDAVVDIVEPLQRFAYRWAAVAGVGVEDGPSTRVEFTLVATATGTEVTVVETGFAALPDDIYESTLRENRSGWKAEMRDLVGFLGVRQEV